jgi:hypothetical protein
MAQKAEAFESITLGHIFRSSENDSTGQNRVVRRRLIWAAYVLRRLQAPGGFYTVRYMELAPDRFRNFWRS